MTPFADQLRAALERAGMSARAFALAARVHPPRITEILRGRRLPPLGQVVHWAAVLGLAGPQRDAFLFAALETALPADLATWVRTWSTATTVVAVAANPRPAVAARLRRAPRSRTNPAG